MTMIKRFILIMLIMLIVNDLCITTRMIGINHLVITSVEPFRTYYSDGSVTYTLSSIYLVIISLITFFKYYFEDIDLF